MNNPVLRMTEHGPAIWCPGCNRAHVFNAPPTPTRKGASWTWNGDAERPTFAPSMHVRIGKTVKPGMDPNDDNAWEWETTCHSFVRDGSIQFLSDSRHALSGQTVPLPEWPGYVRD